MRMSTVASIVARGADVWRRASADGQWTGGTKSGWLVASGRWRWWWWRRRFRRNEAAERRQRWMRCVLPSASPASAQMKPPGALARRARGSPQPRARARTGTVCERGARPTGRVGRHMRAARGQCPQQVLPHFRPFRAAHPHAIGGGMRPVGLMGSRGRRPRASVIFRGRGGARAAESGKRRAEN